jgi:opacity protein-like surface antigen
MQMTKKLLVGLALAVAPVMAHAQGYLELSIGNASADLGGVGANSVDDSDTTFAIGGGYMFNPNLGIEAGYRELGEVSATFVIPPDTIRATLESSGFYVGAVGRFQIAERFSITPRAGLFFWEVDGRGTLNGAPTNVRTSDDGNDLYFGIAASYALTRQFELGVGWTRYDLGGDDVDVVEAKFAVRF